MGRRESHPQVRSGLAARAVRAVEKPLKEVVFDCRMCGQCILHSTGMTCPMRCPKNLRNGPCGGVRANGNCEVYPDKPCVWVQAWQRSRRLPLWRGEIHRINPPVDWRLQGSSSWVNLIDGRDRHEPVGWRRGSLRAKGAVRAG
jgi:hypothetical protein